MEQIDIKKLFVEKLEADDLKRKEWIGDAIFSFIARDVICTNADEYYTDRRYADSFCRNSVMAKVACTIGICDFNEKIHYGNEKHFADIFEVYVYDLYVSIGIDGVRKWFIETVMPLVEKLNYPTRGIVSYPYCPKK